MRAWNQFAMRIRIIIGRDRATKNLDHELAFHIERQTAENLAAGMPPEEAHKAAMRHFGNPALLRDQVHSTWKWSTVESLLRDLRISARSLLRAPGFTIVAVAVMALGIGANVALFTVVRGVLLKPLPFSEPDRLLALYENSDGQFEFDAIAGGIFAGWQQQNHSFTSMSLIGDESFNLSGRQGLLPEKLRGANCSWNLLSTLGVKPALGRDFTAADDQRSANGTVLLSWNLWRRRFNGDPAILNQTIYLNTRPFTVIGVLPRAFSFPDSTTQLLTPIYNDRPARFMKQLDNHAFSAVARLRPGVSSAQGQADLSLISANIRRQNLDNPFIAPAANTRPLLDHMVGDLRKPLYVLLAATGCVLLIACLNVANLLIARSAARRKDMAIRSALGGGRLRLLRERFLESILLAACGGIAGLLLAFGAVRWLVRTRDDLSRLDSIHIASTVALFVVGVVFVCALFSGAISSPLGSDNDLLAPLQDSSRGSGRGRARLRRSLLAVEVGLTVVLLICAGLLLKSYSRLRSSNLGCTSKNILTLHLDVFGRRYGQPAQLAAFYTGLLERVRTIPGVQAASFASAVPGEGYFGDSGFTLPDHPSLPKDQKLFAIQRFVDSQDFQTLGIPLLRSRTFDSSKSLERADEAVISKSFAEQFLPGEDPLGKHIRIMGHVMTVVGIVGDTRFLASEKPQPMQYYSILTGVENNGRLIIRTSGEPSSFALPIQRIVDGMDHDLPVSSILTIDQILGRSVLDTSFNATLLLGFALLSLTLAAVGIFGVLSYVVAQRTSEIGIRLALGASRSRVLGEFLLDGLRPALIGTACGLALSAVAVRAVRSMLYGTQPLDPGIFAGVAAGLILIAALSCLLPAWRASCTNPMQALRTE